MTVNKLKKSRKANLAEGEQYQQLPDHMLPPQIPHSPQSFVSTDSKSSSAGMLAQQLGSGPSWADRFVPELPGSTPVSPSTPRTTAGAGSFSELPSPIPATLVASGMAASRNPTNPQLVPDTDFIRPRPTNVVPDDPPPAYDHVTHNGPSSPWATLPNRQQNILNSIPMDNKQQPKPADPALRTYTRHETFSSISGTFTFFDYLELETKTGSIDIKLDPQPGNTPCVLRIKSQYGSIKVEMLDKYRDILRQSESAMRPWDVIIESQTGSVTTKLPLGNGSNMHIDARTGSLKSHFFVINVGPSDLVSTLSTETNMGSQKVVLEKIQDDVVVSNIAARHYVKGHGASKIEYPGNKWQGRVHASSGGHGSVKIEGDHLQRQHYGNKEQYASRGEGQDVELRCDGHGGITFRC